MAPTALSKWAAEVGLPEVVVKAIREKGLVPESLEKLRALRTAHASANPPLVVQPARWANVTVVNGLLGGLPSATAQTGNRRAHSRGPPAGSNSWDSPAGPEGTAGQTGGGNRWRRPRSARPSTPDPEVLSNGNKSVQNTLVDQVQRLMTENQALRSKLEKPPSVTFAPGALHFSLSGDEDDPI